MRDSTFTALISLVQFDQETVRLQSEAKKVEDELKIFEEKEAKIKQELETTIALVTTMRKHVNDRELEAKTLEEKESKINNRLDEASNEKEYRSAKIELEAIQAKQNELEATLIGAWHALEQAQEAYDKKEEAVEKEQKVLTKQRKEKQEQLAVKNKEIQERITESKKRQTLVPRDLLDRYLHMVSRVSDPVVPVQQGSCSFCFYLISNEDMNTLDRQELLQCKGCYRLLYASELIQQEQA